MKKTCFYYLLLFFFFTNFCIAQNSSDTVNIKTQRSFGIGLNILGASELIGVYADKFINKNVSLEAGIGVVAIYGGAKFHANTSKIGRNSFYSGLLLGYWLVPGNESLEGSTILYLPVGYNLITSRGFNFAIEVAAPFAYSFENQEAELLLFWGQLRFGYRFQKRKK